MCSKYNLVIEKNFLEKNVRSSLLIYFWVEFVNYIGIKHGFRVKGDRSSKMHTHNSFIECSIPHHSFFCLSISLSLSSSVSLSLSLFLSVSITISLSLNQSLAFAFVFARTISFAGFLSNHFN